MDGTGRVAVTAAGGEVSVLTARHAVVICTGSRAALPDLPGMAEARPWTNRKATDSSTVPNRLADVGAGGVGVEMTTAWRGHSRRADCDPSLRSQNSVQRRIKQPEPVIGRPSQRLDGMLGVRH